MTNIVKVYAQTWLKDQGVVDLQTQKLVIDFAHEIDKMLNESLVIKPNEKN